MAEWLYRYRTRLAIGLMLLGLIGSMWATRDMTLRDALRCL